MGRILVFLILTLVASSAFAFTGPGGVGTLSWGAIFNSYPFSSASDAYCSIAGGCVNTHLGEQTSNCSYNSTSRTGSCGFKVRINTTNGDAGDFTAYYKRTDCTVGNPTSEGCDICSTLDPTLDHYLVTGKQFSEGVEPGGLGCFNGCQVVAHSFVRSIFVGQGNLYTISTYTGQSCADDPQAAEVPRAALPDATQGVCTTDGKNACVSTQKKNCGYLKGEYRCITSAQLTDENPCVTTASGSLFCLASAADALKPDAGTPGTVANPTAEYQLTSPDGHGYVVQVWNSNVQGNASTDPGSDAAGDASGKGDCGSKDTPCHVVVDTGGSADGTGTGSGDGNGSGYGDGNGDCTGDNCGAGLPAFGGANDFSKSTADFVVAVHQSEIAQIAVKLANAIPVPTGADTAPEASFSVFNQAFTMKVPDQLWDAILPLAALLFKVMWCFVAIRVFLS